MLLSEAVDHKGWVYTGGGGGGGGNHSLVS